jgi:CRP-like cAMP-binding protein
MTPYITSTSLQNQILAGLPGSDQTRLGKRLQRLSLCAGDSLYEPGDRISCVYFPITAAISILSVMEDGESVVVATVVIEGIVGGWVFFGLVAGTVLVGVAVGYELAQMLTRGDT